jgi:deoxycytidylate deaminase
MNFDRYVELTHALKDNCHNFKCRCKHFSFIVKKNKILSIGINNPKKTHPRNIRYKYTGRFNNDISTYVGVHSELSAVLKYGLEDCTGHILINTRVNAAGEIANSKPCNGCQNLIYQLNFKKVYYTNDAGSFEQLVI